MKLFISLVLLSFVVVLVGCGSDPGPMPKASASNSSSNTAPSPSPSPTVDPAVRAKADRVTTAKSFWSQIQEKERAENKPAWKSEIETKAKPKNVCDTQVRYEAIQNLIALMNKEPKISPNEVSSSLTEEKLSEMKKSIAKDFLIAAKSVTAEEYFKNPCQNDMILNFVEINQLMMEVMEDNNFEPKDYGHSAAAIKANLLAGYKQMVTAWRDGKWADYEISGEATVMSEITFGMTEYGFTNVQLGITADEEKKIRAGETSPTAKAEDEVRD